MRSSGLDNERQITFEFNATSSRRIAKWRVRIHQVCAEARHAVGVVRHGLSAIVSQDVLSVCGDWGGANRAYAGRRNQKVSYCRDSTRLVFGGVDGARTRDPRRDRPVF